MFLQFERLREIWSKVAISTQAKRRALGVTSSTLMVLVWQSAIGFPHSTAQPVMNTWQLEQLLNEVEGPPKLPSRQDNQAFLNQSPGFGNSNQQYWSPGHQTQNHHYPGGMIDQRFRPGAQSYNGPANFAGSQFNPAGQGVGGAIGGAAASPVPGGEMRLQNMRGWSGGNPGMFSPGMHRPGFQQPVEDDSRRQYAVGQAQYQASLAQSQASYAASSMSRARYARDRGEKQSAASEARYYAAQAAAAADIAESVSYGVPDALGYASTARAAANRAESAAAAAGSAASGW